MGTFRLITLCLCLCTTPLFGQGILTPGPNPTEADIQALFNQAVATKQPVVLPPGTFVGNWTITNAKGINIKGASREATVLVSKDKTKPTLDIKGLWYSVIADLSIGTQVGQDYEVLKVDKSPQQGVQANRFENLLIGGRGLNDGKRSKFAMSMCREGSSSAQGSEQLFLNCHFSGASDALYYQTGFNALNNIFIGGNFQDYDKDAIHVTAGSLHVINAGFQSTVGHKQIMNNGWDIACYEAGTIDTILVLGCRTESLRFVKSAWSQPATIIGCSQRIAQLPWYAGVTYKVDDGVVHQGKVYKCKEEHSSTTFDASKWTDLQWYTCYMDSGRIMDSRWDGPVYQKADPNISVLEINGPSTTTLPDNIRLAALSAAQGDVTLALPSPYLFPYGTSITVKRVDASTNTATITAAWLNDYKHSITLGPRKSLTFYAIGGGNFTRRWYCDE